MTRSARHLGAAVAACTWLGCSAPASSLPAPLAIADVPSAQAARATPSDLDDAPAVEIDPWQVEGLPPPLVPAAPVACRLPPAIPPHRVVGRLRPGGEEAFSVIGAQMEVALMRGDGGPGSAFFTGSRDGLQLRGAMNQGDLRLFATEPVVLGGWVVTRHNTKLLVRRITDASVEVDVDPLYLEDVGAKTALRATVSCKRLLLDQADPFPPWAGLPTALPTPGVWGNLVGDPVPLSLEPEGSPVALLATASNDAAAVLDRQGSWTRVAVPRQLVLVFGWVPSSRVQVRPQSVEDRGGGFGFGTGSGGSSLRPLRCPRPLSIAVELGDDRFVALRADPGIELLPPGEATDGRVPISFYRRHWLHLAEGATMWVRETDLSGCAVTGG